MFALEKVGVDFLRCVGLSGQFVEIFFDSVLALHGLGERVSKRLQVLLEVLVTKSKLFENNFAAVLPIVGHGLVAGVTFGV